MAPGPGNPDPYRIVASWPGRGTGDTNYRTADGRTWVPCNGIEPRTGQEIAAVEDGRLRPKQNS